MEQFYLQDSRNYVGNDVLWWAKGGNGYTTDVSKAQPYSRDDAQRQHNMRPTDIPWPISYIDAKTRPAVDMQYIKRDEALAGTGIVLKPREKAFGPKREPFRCNGCGRVMSERQFWSGECGNCGTDSRP